MSSIYPPLAVRSSPQEPSSCAPGPLTIVVVGGFADSLLNFRGALLARLAASHRVIACAPAASPAVRRRLAELGVSYREVAIDRASIRPDRDLVTLFHLNRLFREIRPDMVLAYTIKPVIWGGLAGRLAGVPKFFALITGLGASFAGSGRKGRALQAVVEALYRRSLRGAEKVFFQNPDDRALFEAHGLTQPAQAVVVNGSGVDLSHFVPAALPPQPSFLLVGRLLAHKGVREYVEAARRLRARHPEVRCRLVGWRDTANPTSISEAELESWVEEGVIDYLGRLDDVRPALAATAVYVQPSIWGEGLPRSILEAMAMGRPVITTDAPGCRQTVRDGENGYLVPVKDVAALTAAMQRFVVDPALIAVMGAASRRRATDEYDVHAVNAMILAAMGLAPEGHGDR